MAEATEGVPSDGLKGLIAEAIEEGRALERCVRDFVPIARQAALEFASETEPLHLSDEFYEEVSSACGLTDLFALSQRMAEHLGQVVVT